MKLDTSTIIRATLIVFFGVFSLLILIYPNQHIRNSFDKGGTKLTDQTISSSTKKPSPTATLYFQQGEQTSSDIQTTMEAQSDMSPSQQSYSTKTLQPSPTPTQSISPTNTSQPSLAPTGQPLGFFTGSGNLITEIGQWQEPLIISFSHNGGGVFKALLHDTSNEIVSALVETTGPYEGSQVINTGGVQYGAIEVQANGIWQMEIQSLDNAILLALPVTINAKNADVYHLDRMIYELDFDASSSSGWVTVIGYGENGLVNVIINERAPFSKTIEVKDPDILYLEVVTLGEWLLKLK